MLYLWRAGDHPRLLESRTWGSADHSSCSQSAVWYAVNPARKALSSSLWNLLHLFHKVTLNLFNLLHHCFCHPHLMHWVDNWRRRFIRQLNWILEGQFLHVMKGNVSFYFIFYFTFSCLLPYWTTLPQIQQYFLVLLTNQKLSGNYQYHILRDYLAQQHSPPSPCATWKRWEQKNSEGLWLLCLFKGFFWTRHLIADWSSFRVLLRVQRAQKLWQKSWMQQKEQPISHTSAGISK